MQAPKQGDIAVYNYCVSFIDLLGQKEAFRDQGLVPQFKSDEEREDFLQTIRKSIAAVASLQEDASGILAGLNDVKRKPVNGVPQLVQDEIRKENVTKQHWSDGFISYLCLGDSAIKCPMNGIFSLIVQAGVLCFLGLCKNQPIRGGIDVAWGVEVSPAEFYGAALVRAYELESKIAQYPRIVLGRAMYGYLQSQIINDQQDIYSMANKELAEICLNLLLEDVDGALIVNYLGNEFQAAVTRALHPEMYREARKFVVQEFEKHRQSEDSKLAFRYAHLLSYFDRYAPHPNGN